MTNPSSADERALLPCPFCGDEKASTAKWYGKTWMRCGTCGTQGPIADVLESAADFWNRRASLGAAQVPASLLAKIRKLPMVRAREIDGEESDGTPISWRDRPFVSLTQLERLLSESAGAAQVPSLSDAQIDEALEAWFSGAEPVGANHECDRRRMRLAISAALSQPSQQGQGS